MVAGVRSGVLLVGITTLVACGGGGGEASGSSADAASDTMDSGMSGGSTSSTDPSDDDTSAGATSDASANPTVGDESGGESSEGSGDLGEKISLRVGDFAVPSIETSYNCWDFTFSLDQLGHITAFDAVIDNAAHVHHFVVTLTEGGTNSADGYSCFDLAGDMIWAWAPGETRFELPENAGFLVGDTPGGQVTLRLQVHYNNPLNVTGQTDNSGFDFWVTPELRENNAGTLVFGDIEGIQIPPGEPAHEHIMTCRSEVTAAQFPGPLHVFGTSMHAHNLGSVLYSEVYRDGEMILEMNRDDPFDFENQNMKAIDFELLPGDQVVNHCIYDSTGVDETTFGGPGTTDEMCWNTIAYYPKIPSGFDYCSSYD